MLPDEARPGFLFLLPWELYHPGGVNQVVINLFYQAQKSMRWHPMVCADMWEFPYPEYREVENRPTVYVRLRSPWNKRRPILGLITFLVYLPSSLLILRRMLDRDKIAVVNAHYPTLSTLLFSILRKFRGSKCKLILSFHGQDIENALKATGLERWLWRRLLRSADAIAACSVALRQRVLMLAPDCDNKTSTIHNGLDAALFQARRDNAYRLDTPLIDRGYVLNVATFEHKKGQDVLIEAFHSIAEEFADLILVLVGGAGPTLANLKIQAHKLGLDNRVFFYQDVPHARIPTFLEHAKLFCLPSRVEPFGIVLLEAGLFEIPVIASRVGGIPEIITDNKNGRLVEPNDPVALAMAMRALLLNENDAARYGKQLSLDVIQRFTWTRAFDEYAQLNAK
jgi:glycosyltransferase involved in cell wall biosynthesis